MFTDPRSVLGPDGVPLFPDYGDGMKATPRRVIAASQGMRPAGEHHPIGYCVEFGPVRFTWTFPGRASSATRGALPALRRISGVGSAWVCPRLKH